MGFLHWISAKKSVGDARTITCLGWVEIKKNRRSLMIADSDGGAEMEMEPSTTVTPSA